MKKLITYVFIFSMVCSMGTLSTFADNEKLNEIGKKEIDVKAMYNDQVSIVPVYSVDLVWGAMEFTYTATGTKTWNFNTKRYDVNTTATWMENGNDITVTNHSNKAVTASFVFEALNTYSTVTGSFLNASVFLASADKEGVTEAELTATTELTLSGMLDKTVDTLTNVGKITVTIA